jgi:hypothetical protein
MRAVRWPLAIVGVLALCSCDSSDVPIVEADRSALVQVTPADAVDYLARIAQVHAFPVHLANATAEPCLYTATQMGPNEASIVAFARWSYTQYSAGDVVEGRRIYAVLAGIPSANLACVAYSRSAPTLTPEIRQEIQDVVTAFEGLGVRQRRILERM